MAEIRLHCNMYHQGNSALLLPRRHHSDELVWWKNAQQQQQSSCPYSIPWGGACRLGRKVATQRWGARKVGCCGWGGPGSANKFVQWLSSFLLLVEQIKEKIVFRQAVISIPSAVRLQVQTNTERYWECTAVILKKYILLSVWSRTSLSAFLGFGFLCGRLHSGRDTVGWSWECFPGRD